MPVLRTAAAILLLTGACATPQVAAVGSTPTAPDVMAEAVARGRLLTTRACSSCHATGLTGASPMADATPFRVIVHRYPLNQLEEAFAEGLVTGHPAMPEFVFRASEIDDLVAYLETVKAGS